MAAFGGSTFKDVRRIRAAGQFAAGGAVCILIIAAALGAIDFGDGSRRGAGVTPAEQGAALYEAGAHSAAAKTLRAAHRIDPTAENRLRLVRALHASGDYYGVLEAVRDAARPSAQLRLYRVEALLRVHDFARAEKEAQSLLEVRESRPAAEFILARAAYGRGDAERAKALTNAVIRLSPAHAPEAWLFRARMALDGNDADLAVSAARRAGEAGAAEARVAAMRIEAALRKGDLAAAQSRFEARRRRLAPRDGRGKAYRDPEGAYLRALIDAKAGETQGLSRTIELARSWLEHEPRGPLRLAALHWRAGDEARARAAALGYLERAPGDTLALDLLAVIAAGEGKAAVAVAAAKALEAADRSLGAYRLHAAQMMAGNLDAAHGIVSDAGARPAPLEFTTAVEVLLGRPFESVRARRGYAQRIALASGRQDPCSARAPADEADAVLLTLIGARSLTRSCARAAAGRLDRALDAAPDFRAALEWRTVADVRDGAFGAAADRLERRLEARPDDTEAALLLARVRYAAGDADGARRRLEPLAPRLIARPPDALFYASLLGLAGEAEMLRAFAETAGARAPDAPLAGELFERAGLLNDAARARRAAMLADPEDPARVANYVDAMVALSRQSAARSLLLEIQRRNSTAAVSSALQSLAADSPAPAAPDPRAAGPGAGVETARRAFERDPRDPEKALAYALALQESGAPAAGAYRMACFRGSAPACQAAGESDS